MNLVHLIGSEIKKLKKKTIHDRVHYKGQKLKDFPVIKTRKKLSNVMNSTTLKYKINVLRTQRYK